MSWSKTPPPGLDEAEERSGLDQATSPQDPSVRFVVPEGMNIDEWDDWFATLDDFTRWMQRTAIIISGVQVGHSCQELGSRYGVSAQRIRQIAAAGGVDLTELRRQQREQADRYRSRIEQNIFNTSLAHPELEISELADLWGVDETTVRRALAHRLLVHEVRIYKGIKSRISDETLLAGLREWAAQSSNPTSDDYTAWAHANGLPGQATPTNRFGRWNSALHAAGLSHIVDEDRGGQRPQVSDDAMWASVLEFFRSDLPSFSSKAYEVYASEHGLASLTTVRVRLGSWSVVHARIRRLLRYAADPDGTWEFGDRILAISPRSEPRAILTKEEVLDSLVRVAATIEGPVTVTAYESARTRDDPSAILIQKRFGESWVEALIAAGLESRLSAVAYWALFDRLARGRR